MIDLTGKAYREGGQWKVRLELPDWVIDDILRDSQHMERVVITLQDAVIYPGESHWSSGKGKAPKVITTAIFTEEGIE